MIRHPLTRAAPLLLLLAWAPLPFASVTPAAASGAIAAAFLVLALAAMTTPEAWVPSCARHAAAAIAAVGAWGFAQSIAWPASIASRLAPEHARLQRETASLLDADPPTGFVLSLAPGASRRAALLWLAVAAVLVAAALVGRSRRARRGLFAAIAASALLQVIYGAQQWAARATAIWGFEVPNQPSRLRGSFVNPNHLATYLLIATAASFALLWWSLRRLRGTPQAERWIARVGPPALLWTILFAGLAFTRSRSGLIAGLGGFIVQLALVAYGKSHRRVVWGGVAALVLAISFIAWTGFETGFGRFLRVAVERDFRLAAMADATTLVQRFPLTGVGLGAFRTAFPLVHAFGEEGSWWHLHNDWLELAVTTGVVGVVLAGIALGFLARGLLRMWRTGDRSEDRAAALAALGACVAVALQELLDFGLTLPANSLTLAAVCGAALGARRRPVADPDRSDEVAAERANGS